MCFESAMSTSPLQGIRRALPRQLHPLFQKKGNVPFSLAEACQTLVARKISLKTGFRAKDAKNAKKLLQGELVEFVYESFDVTFEELTAKVYQ